jgi:hypothetical protein
MRRGAEKRNAVRGDGGKEAVAVQAADERSPFLQASLCSTQNATSIRAPQWVQVMQQGMAWDSTSASGLE